MGRRLVAAWLAVLVVGGAAYVLVGVLRDRDPTGYPQRIGFERPSDPLPERPGVLAATFVDNDFGNARGLGVTASGDLYELPGDTALSPDGTVLLAQSWTWDDWLEVRDLVTGEISQVSDLPRRLRVRPGIHWSPDATRVLIGSTAHPRRDEGPSVVDLDGGAITPLAAGTPAGFVSSSEVMTVTVGDELVATTTDIDAGTSTEQTLRASGGWTGDPMNPPSAAVSPDGELLLLVESVRGDDPVRVFALDDGREVASPTVHDWDGCPPMWQGDDPVLPVTTQPGGAGSTRWAGAFRVTEDGATSLVAVHPRLQSTCLQLTTAALEAGPRWALLGTSTSMAAWYAGPATAVVLLGVGAVLLVRRWVKRARRRGSTRRSAARTGQSRTDERTERASTTDSRA